MEVYMIWSVNITVLLLIDMFAYFFLEIYNYKYNSYKICLQKKKIILFSKHQCLNSTKQENAAYEIKHFYYSVLQI